MLEPPAASHLFNTLVLHIWAGIIEGMSDGDRFLQTRDALVLIGMTPKEISELLSAVSGVLHLGQASFVVCGFCRFRLVGFGLGLYSWRLMSNLRVFTLLLSF